MDRLLSFLKNNKKIEVLYLIGSSAINIFSGILVSHLIAKMISPDDYGLYYFTLNTITSACVLLSFGVFYTASRSIILAQNETSTRKIHAITFLATTLLTIFIGTILLAFSIIEISFTDSKTRHLMLLAPLGVLITLTGYYFETVLPADNKIKLIAKSRLYPKFAYAILILFLYHSKYTSKPSTFILLLAYFLTSIGCYAYLLKDIKPLFKELKNEIRGFIYQSKIYGFNVYLGSIFSVGGTALTGVAIGYLGDSPSDIGYYALATSLCTPLSILPAAISTVSFSSFASTTSIPKRILFGTIAISLISAISISTISEYLVLLLWGDKYSKVSNFVYVLSVAFVLYAVSDLINRFLAAKGIGQALRNSSFIVGITLMISTLTMIQIYGGIGATYARVFAGIAYLACMTIYYRKQIATPKTEDY